MIRTEAWTQNAMLYKDVTQWMRRRTFLTFFFGLLGIAEVTALLVAMSDTEQGGLIIFGILTGVTLLYLIGLAGMAFRLFADELGNRTFELFEMAGMSLERMILGKLVSSMVCFVFGFFAVVPFVFFGYLLGGLDFFRVLVTAIFLFLLAPLMFQWALALASALHHLKTKWLVYAGMAIMLVGGSWSLLYFVIWFAFDSPTQDLLEFFQKALKGDSDALLLIGFLTLTYLFVNGILFYFACNAISRSSDSREGILKALVALLAFLLMAAVAPDSPEVAAHIGFFAILIVGLVFLYNRGDPPIIAQRRIERAGPNIRLLRRFFAAGSRPTLRILLTLLVLYAATVCIAMAYATSNVSDLAPLVLPLVAFFHLGFPAVFVVLNKRARTTPPILRGVVLSWWILGSTVFTIIMATSSAAWMRSGGPGLSPTYLIGLVGSPISAVVATDSANINSGDDIFAATLLAIMGVVGIVLCHIVSRRMPTRDKSPAPPDALHTPEAPDDEPADGGQMEAARSV